MCYHFSMNCDALIFDMDGTLVEWSQIITDAWNAIFEAHHWHKKISKADFMAYAGHTTAEIGQMAFPDLPEEESKERISLASALEVDYVRKNATWKDNFVPSKEFLKELSQKKKLFIVSNCMAGYIEAFLEIYDLAPYFVDYLDNRFGVCKADNIKAIVKTHHLKAPLYIGDTMMDLKASEAAKVPFVHATYGYGQFEYPTSISSLEDLLDLIR